MPDVTDGLEVVVACSSQSINAPGTWHERRHCPTMSEHKENSKYWKITHWHQAVSPTPLTTGVKDVAALTTTVLKVS